MSCSIYPNTVLVFLRSTGSVLNIVLLLFCVDALRPSQQFSAMSGHFQGDIHGAYTNTNNYCTNINQMISVLPKDTTQSPPQ